MKIIIGCSRNEKIGSKLLQWWMKSEYSHVYARWHLDFQERDIVYQASHGMVHQVEYNRFKVENIVVEEFELNLKECQFKKFSQKCIDLSGQPYSMLELLQIFIYDITLGKVTFKNQSGYVCSELIAELLEDFFNIKFNKPRYLIRPDDVIKLLKSQVSY